MPTIEHGKSFNICSAQLPAYSDSIVQVSVLCGAVGSQAHHRRHIYLNVTAQIVDCVQVDDSKIKDSVHRIASKCMEYAQHIVV